MREHERRKRLQRRISCVTGQPPQLVTELLGRGHDHAAQLDEREPTHVDGAAPRKQQHPQRLLALARARQRQRLGREPGAGSPDRVERVVLATQPPLAAGVTADLEHRLAALGEVARETGTVVAGALDRPGTNAARVLLRESAAPRA